MAAPYHSEIPITYLEVEQPKANEIVLSYIRQKMLITMDKDDHTCNDDTSWYQPSFQTSDIFKWKNYGKESL